MTNSKGILVLGLSSRWSQIRGCSDIHPHVGLEGGGVHSHSQNPKSCSDGPIAKHHHESLACWSRAYK